MIKNQLEQVKAVGEVIETAISTVWRGSDGICRIIIHEGAEIEIEEMKESVAVRNQLIGNKRAPVLNDMRRIRSVTREARSFPSQPENANYVLAMAILQNSAVTQIIGNLFVNFSKPPYPTKLFASEEDAIRWLRGLIE